MPLARLLDVLRWLKKRCRAETKRKSDRMKQPYHPRIGRPEAKHAHTLRFSMCERRRCLVCLPFQDGQAGPTEAD